MRSKNIIDQVFDVNQNVLQRQSTKNLIVADQAAANAAILASFEKENKVLETVGRSSFRVARCIQRNLQSPSRRPKWAIGSLRLA